MPSVRDKVVVAMSGGVDSSVAACLLVEQGYEVMGLFMRVGAPEPPGGNHEAAKPASNEGVVPCSPAEFVQSPNHPIAQSAIGTPAPRAHQGCCSASDAADARYVAGMLGIPFYALNFEKDFDRLIDYFADEYANGRTPNPCVMCNNDLKFGKVVEYADAVGARFIATGHYGRVDRQQGNSRLLRARDSKKDQSYVLFGLDRNILDRIQFPIGDLTKPEVRAIAARYGLPNQDKPDSVEICFVPDRDYARVVRQRRPDRFSSGDVLDQSGAVIGRHEGLGHFTIGQRRGLGIALGQPHYVTNLNVAANTVTLGPADALLAGGLEASRANFLIDCGGAAFRADVKIRYLHTAVPATVSPMGDGRVKVIFDQPQRAVTPGQAVVFYDGDVVLGGAWIEGALDPRRSAAGPVAVC